jgi:hypothetical protein
MEFKTYTHEGSADALWGGLLGNFLSTTLKRVCITHWSWIYGNVPIPVQALYLSNNGLKSLPSTLFKMCLQLSTLDLHNTQITMDLLRQVHMLDPFAK